MSRSHQSGGTARSKHHGSAHHSGVLRKVSKEMSNCVTCKQPVPQDMSTTDIADYYNECCRQADALGMETLTEYQQVLVERKVCSERCYVAML